MYILYFTHLTPSITLFLLPCFPMIWKLTMHFIMLCSYTGACISVLFTLYHSLFPPLSPHSHLGLSLSLYIYYIYVCNMYIYNICILYIYIYTKSYVYMCVHLFFGCFNFYLWGKTCKLCSLSFWAWSTLFNVMIKIPFIFLETTYFH
jgi:hypothetical protein